MVPVIFPECTALCVHGSVWLCVQLGFYVNPYRIIFADGVFLYDGTLRVYISCCRCSAFIAVEQIDW